MTFSIAISLDFLYLYIMNLKVYMKESDPKSAVRYFLLNITLDNNILNIPLYAIWNTED